MITENGYSKDHDIIPDGIAVTFGKEMILEQDGLKKYCLINHCIIHLE